MKLPFPPPPPRWDVMDRVTYWACWLATLSAVVAITKLTYDYLSHE